MVNETLIQALYNLLVNQITYKSEIIPVFTIPDKAQTYPCIIIHGFDQREGGTKCEFIFDGSFRIEVITSSKGRTLSLKPCYDIVNSVFNKIKPNRKSVISLNTNYSMILLTLQNDSEIREQTSNETIIRRILTFETSIEKLT